MTFAWRIQSVFAEFPEVLMRHDGIVLTFPKAENSLHTAGVYWKPQPMQQNSCHPEDFKKKIIDAQRIVLVPFDF